MATMCLWKEAKHLPFYKLYKSKLGMYVCGSSNVFEKHAIFNYRRPSLLLKQ